MRIVALASLLVAGSVSLAAAGPDRDEPTGRVTMYERAKRHVVRDGDWVQLATPTPVKHQREYISLGEDAGMFNRLRIDASAGRPIVLTVRINFKDGTSRTARIDRSIDKRRPIEIDLKGTREVDSLVVVTDPVSTAEYRVMGLPGGTGIARR